MAAKSFLLKIVTPQQLFYSGEVEMVVVEQASGQEGYMAGHSPALKRLEKGEVKTMAVYTRYAGWKAEE